MPYVLPMPPCLLETSSSDPGTGVQAAAGAMAERFLAQLAHAQPGVRSLATTGVLTLLVGGQGAAWHQARLEPQRHFLNMSSVRHVLHCTPLVRLSVCCFGTGMGCVQGRVSFTAIQCVQSQALAWSGVLAGLGETERCF